MKKILINSFLLLCFLNLGNQVCPMYFSDILEPDGSWKVHTPYPIGQIQRLQPRDGEILTAAQKLSLVNSHTLRGIRTLILKNQDIDDEFIELLCNNWCFERVINLDLRANPRITSSSLSKILTSDSLGSVKDMRQISGRYGLPSSEINIQVDGTYISEEEIRWFNENPRTDFSIYYRHPVTNQPYYGTSDDNRSSAIKWLRVEPGIHIPTNIFIYSHKDIYFAQEARPNDIRICLQEIEDSLGELKGISGTPTPVIIDFSVNSLDVECVKEIRNFCKEDNYLQDNLISLNLSHNQLTVDAFPYLIELTNICPKLVIDISINYISQKEIANDPILSVLVKQNKIICRAL